MSDLLPQQHLLLELIQMSGDISVPKRDDGSVLFRTLKECEDLRLVAVTPDGDDHNTATVTLRGRKAL
ncbi:MAG: hypothetical protein COB46_01645 [Rhodospirillaceae bacterium]|nr:MAG: hypothetical protein COB46_01645 [Rhodospirillaceae bacterium]